MSGARQPKPARAGVVGGLTDPDFIRNNPNVNLPEPFFQGRFETLKEFSVFRRVFHINKQPHVLIGVSLALMNPKSLKRLGQI
jgi:hypothetical protein